MFFAETAELNEGFMLKKQWHFYISILGATVPVVMFVLWMWLSYVIYVTYKISNDDIEKYLTYGFSPVLYLSNGIGVLLPGYLTKRKLKASLPTSFYLKTVSSVWFVLSLVWFTSEKLSRYVEVNSKTVSLFFAFNFLVCSIVGWYFSTRAEKNISASDAMGRRMGAKKMGFIIKGLIGAAVAASIIGYTWLRYSKTENWTPAGPEQTARVVFAAKWGTEGVGFYKASGKDDDTLNDGFQNFYIKGNKVYIADFIKREICVFEDNKQVRAYPYPAYLHIDLGMAVSDEFIYMLDDGGNISKINLNSGQSTVRRRAIMENEYGVLAVNSFSLYLLDATLIAEALLDKDRCFSATDLSETPCPFKEKDSPEEETVYLPGGFQASVEGPNMVLHDPTGGRVGRVRGYDEVNLIYPAGRNLQVDMNGVYYAEHFDTGVKIYFKPWQR